MKINKNKFEGFLRKYNLSGNVEVTRVEISDRVMKTNFITQDRNVLGILQLFEINLPDRIFGIYNTTNLLKMLSVLPDEFEIEFLEKDERILGMYFTTENMRMYCSLADLQIIPESPVLKYNPESTVILAFDNDLVNKILKILSVMQQKYFLVSSDENEVNLIFGEFKENQKLNSNQISLKLSALKYGKIEALYFRADYFKEILSNNRDFEKCIFEISELGLGKIFFNSNEYSASYYLIANKAIKKNSEEDEYQIEEEQ